MGGFQRPVVDPDSLNPSVQKGYNVPLGTELFYPLNELELHRQLCHLFMAAALYVSSPALLHQQRNKPSTAHPALCSHTGKAEGKGIIQFIVNGAKWDGWQQNNI